ncbi:MAG TPA: phosphotransferase family protein [Rhizomicrobium sp.]|jgi:aminoglycoside phosphotransferase (APT) family kinase protein|nr:phosphotransferase family protein [Rhizomicrobium sp.]
MTMERPDFLPALERALKSALPEIEAIEGLARLSGGASQETWSFDARTARGAMPLILRRAPGGARAMVEGSTSVPLATEAAAIEAARAGGVTVPRVRCVLAQKDGAGEGYVMDRLEGETIARKILRDEAFSTARAGLARQCGEMLARIHRVEVAPLRPLLPAVDGPAQLRAYREAYDSFDYPHPVFEMAFRWLEPRLRPVKAQTLVHGDFRLGNLLVPPKGPAAALDWELVHIGDPLEDIGWLCARSWRFGVMDRLVGGFGDLADLLEAYEGAGGARFDPDAVRAWIVYGSLKWGVMCMKMYRGFLADGSVERAAIGRRCSETEIDLIGMIMGGKS